LKEDRFTKKGSCKFNPIRKTVSVIDKSKKLRIVVLRIFADSLIITGANFIIFMAFTKVNSVKICKFNKNL
jgi:hypothetical protein